MVLETIKRLIIIIGLVLLYCNTASAGTTKDYSLVSAWQRLLAISDKLAAEDAGVERASLNVEAAEAMYFPEVKINAQYIHLDDDIDLTPEMLFDNMNDGEAVSHLIGAIGGSMGVTPAQLNSAATTHVLDQDNLLGGITAIWPIYTGGRIDAAQDIAEGQYREAAQRRSMVEREQFEELVERYYGVVFVEQVVQTRMNVEEGLEHHLRNAKLLEKQGQISKVERLQAAASADKARVERKKTERQLEIARTALAKMLKTDSQIIPVDALFINVALPDINYFIDKTHSGYPGLNMLKAKKDQALGMVDVEEGKYHPEVAVMGDYMVHDNNSLTTELAPDWFIGVGVSFTLFDRDGRSEKLESAKTAIRQVDSLIAQAEKDLSILTEQNYHEAMQAMEEYHGLESSLELAEESVKLRNKSFSQGLSTSLDVVDAEMFLAGVKIQRSLAVYNYIKYLSKLLVLSGDINQFAEYQSKAASL